MRETPDAWEIETIFDGGRTVGSEVEADAMGVFPLAYQVLASHNPKGINHSAYSHACLDPWQFDL